MVVPCHTLSLEAAYYDEEQSVEGRMMILGSLVQLFYINHVLFPQRAHRYLIGKGKSRTDLRHFKSQLYYMWFRLYHRDRSGG